MQHASRLGALVLTGALALAACGSDGSSSKDTTAPTTAVAETTDASATTEAATTGSEAAATGTVDANTATVAELTAAFEAAGIPNAEKWADEVEEYRPYATDDPTFAKLRQELAKYNPPADVVDQIIATLNLG